MKMSTAGCLALITVLHQLPWIRDSKASLAAALDPIRGHKSWAHISNDQRLTYYRQVLLLKSIVINDGHQ